MRIQEPSCCSRESALNLSCLSTFPDSVSSLLQVGSERVVVRISPDGSKFSAAGPTFTYTGKFKGNSAYSEADLLNTLSLLHRFAF